TRAGLIDRSAFGPSPARTGLQDNRIGRGSGRRDCPQNGQPISAPTSSPVSSPRSARPSASIRAPFRPSRVGDRTDSYSRLWQDVAKLAAIPPFALRATHSPAESGLSRGASFWTGVPGIRTQSTYLFGQSRFLSSSVNLDSRSENST